MEQYKAISIFVFIVAFCLLLVGISNESNDSKDVLIKYNEVFFTLSFLTAMKWLTTDDFQRGVFYVILSAINIFISYAYFTN